MNERKISPWQLEQRRALPLDAKVELSTRRIRQWCEHYDDNVYVSFSGGLDSTVVLHLVRQVYPECPAVFCDTGLEFPEIRDFVKTIDNVVWLKPKATFKATLETHGFPVVSKSVATKIRKIRKNPFGHSAKLYMTGITSDGRQAPSFKLAKKWQRLIWSPFKISEKCCDVFKKEPFRRYVRETGRVPLSGTRASESRARQGVYLEFGCNAFDKKTGPMSMPIAFWTAEDVKQYIAENRVPYSKIYDMGYERTGCMFCMFGAHLEKGENRFQTLQRTHPVTHRYCMEKLGLKEVLEYVGVNPYLEEDDE